jgi:tetratricopeptide (TPR) repeat protein
MVQVLFGELGLASLSGHTSFLDRATRETGRHRKVSAEVAFGAYIVARLIDALLELDDTPDSLAGFAWQRDVAANHIRQLPKEVSEVGHLAGIIDAIPADGNSPSALPVSLTAYAYFLEHEGRLEEALDILALSARTWKTALTDTELAAYALFAGKLNRLLARWNQALACYQMAEQAGRAAGDYTIMLRGRLHQGAVARGQGNLPKAREIAEGVAAEANERGLAQVQGIAYADLSAVYSLQGLPLEGIRAGYAAFLVAPTPSDRISALGDLAISLAEIGATDQARLALEIVAAAKTEFRFRTNAVIELMDLESAAGNRLAFERHRAAAEACRDRMSPAMAVDYLFKTGMGQARFGLVDRARETLGLALQAAETHALHAWYFRIEETLEHLATPATVELKVHSSPDLTQAPVIYEVELGLREFSAAVLV